MSSASPVVSSSHNHSGDETEDRALLLERYAPLTWVLAGILGLAAVLRLVGLAAVSLQGDEYRSLDEATGHFGANLTSLLYDVILRAMMQFGTGVEVVRLPSVIFGVASVFAVYLLADALIDRATALVASLLMATSAYAIGYSQEVRFYTLFLFAGILALYALIVLVRDGTSKRRIVWLVAANILCLAAHGLGAIVVVGEAVSLVLLTAPPHRVFRRFMVLCGFVVVGVFALTLHAVSRVLTTFLDRYQDSQLSYSSSRGLHLTNFVKIGWNFFVFSFGERVYPLWLWLTVPGAILVFVLVARGLWFHRNNRLVLGILLPQLILGPLILYLVLDAVTASQFTGASARYLMPMLGPFLIFMAAGITSWRRTLALGLSLVLVILLNVVTVYAYWQNNWNYSGYTADWPRVATIIAQNAFPGKTVILVDGRSTDPARYYFSRIERSHHLRQLALGGSAAHVAARADRVVVVTDTDRLSQQVDINRTLLPLQSHFEVVGGMTRYPLFVYVMAKASAPAIRPLLRPWRMLPLPPNIYDVSLADIRLPAHIRIPNGPHLTTYGALTLSQTSGTQDISLRMPRAPITRVVLATSLQGDARLRNGASVASVTLSGTAAQRSVVLRKGQMVEDWRRAGSSKRRPGAAYTVGYRWTKLISLEGKRAYPEAYSQFRAGIAVATVPVPRGQYTSVRLHYVAAKGILRVWALAIR